MKLYYITFISFNLLLPDLLEEDKNCILIVKRSFQCANIDLSFLIQRYSYSRSSIDNHTSNTLTFFRPFELFFRTKFRLSIHYHTNPQSVCFSLLSLGTDTVLLKRFLGAVYSKGRVICILAEFSFFTLYGYATDFFSFLAICIGEYFCAQTE